MTEASLKDLRNRLKTIDEKIIHLLNERAELSIQIGNVKKNLGLAIYDPAQESSILRNAARINQGPLPEESLNHIFREILSASRTLQAPLSVAYLGPQASFTHLAARAQFGTSALLSPQPAISDIFDTVEKQRASWGVVPVENSLEGTVKLTLDRLIGSSLKIMAEIYLPIHHALMSTGKDLARLKRVYSHPQALAQCQAWLRTNLSHCSIHETESTATAAMKVLEDGDGAAIGSPEAAHTYGLNIVADGIEDHASNMTRFLVIGQGNNRPTGRDKTSIIFGTRHEPGALYHSLRPFAEKEINLLKIVSHPIKDRMWEYLFFVDFTGHTDEDDTKKCMEALQQECTFIKTLGSYPMGDPES